MGHAVTVKSCRRYAITLDVDGDRRPVCTMRTLRAAWYVSQRLLRTRRSDLCVSVWIEDTLGVHVWECWL